jgi:hypothetical protein
MKTQILSQQMAVCVALLSTALLAGGQVYDSTSTTRVYETTTYELPPKDPNRVWAGGRAVFNVKAKFQYGAPASNPGPGPGVHAVNRTYDNGYVGVDDSGNAGDMTWNWGFNDAPGQPPAVSGTTLELRSTTSPAQGSSSKETDDPHYGFEVGYGRVLSRGDAGGGTEVVFGIEGSFNMTWLDIENRESISGIATTTTDSYDMSGLPVIPSSPYRGSSPTPGGPLPLLLPDSPFDRSTVDTPTTAVESGRIEGELYGFKLGPFAEVELWDVVGLQIRGGLAVVLADTEFEFTETLTPGGTTTGRVSDDDWLFGGFVEVRVTVEVARHVSLYVSGGYQHVKDQTLSAGTHRVKLDLGDVLTAAAGVSVSF